jgi:hypothetical protein
MIGPALVGVAPHESAAAIATAIQAERLLSMSLPCLKTTSAITATAKPKPLTACIIGHSSGRLCPSGVTERATHFVYTASTM